MYLGEDCVCVFGPGKAVEYLDLSELFYGSLEEKNVENNAVDGTLACEVSEVSKDTKVTICVIFLWKESMVSVQLGLKSKLRLTTDQNQPLK